MSYHLSLNKKMVSIQLHVQLFLVQGMRRTIGATPLGASLNLVQAK
jgi:hypothetical protein